MSLSCKPSALDSTLESALDKAIRTQKKALNSEFVILPYRRSVSDDSAALNNDTNEAVDYTLDSETVESVNAMLQSTDSFVRSEYLRMEAEVQDVYNSLSSLGLPHTSSVYINASELPAKRPKSAAVRKQTSTNSSKKKKAALSPKSSRPISASSNGKRRLIVESDKLIHELPSRRLMTRRPESTISSQHETTTHQSLFDSSVLNRLNSASIDLSEGSAVYSGKVVAEMLPFELPDSSVSEKISAIGSLLKASVWRDDGRISKDKSLAKFLNPIASRSNSRPSTASASKPQTAATISDTNSASNISPIPKRISRPKTGRKSAAALVNSGNIQDDKVEPLPLEYFDDDVCYETHTPTEWIQLGKRMGLKGTPAVSRFYDKESNPSGEWKWHKCFVIDYDEKSARFLIEWEDGGAHKSVNRLNLMFQAENRELFFERLETADRYRRDFESLVHYHKQINALPKNGMAPLPKRFKLGALKKVAFPITAKEVPIVEKCFKEMDDAYTFSMKKTKFDFTSNPQKSPENHTKAVVSPRSLPNIHTQDYDTTSNHVTQAAQIMNDFMFSADFSLQKASAEILNTLKQVLPSNESFFEFRLDYPVKYETFVDRALVHGEGVQFRLASMWPQAIAACMKNLLSEVFDFHMTKMSVYENGRCKNFMRLVNSIMESQLRSVVLSGFKKFLALFQIDLTENDANSISNGKSINNYSNSSLNTITKSSYTVSRPFYIKRMRSLFIVQITIMVPALNEKRHIVNNELVIPSPKNEVVLHPTYEHFQSSFKDILSMPQRLCFEAVPQIETVALQGLQFNNNLWIVSLRSNDELVTSAVSFLDEILAPCWNRIKEVFNDYRDFEFLIQESLAGEYDDTPLEDLEISLQRICEAKEDLETQLPNIVDCAPLILDCTLIKRTLLNSAEYSFNLIQSMLSERCESICTLLLSVCERIHKKIIVDPSGDAEVWKCLKIGVSEGRSELNECREAFEEGKIIWDFMFQFRMEIEDELSDSYWKAYHWPTILDEDLRVATVRLDETYSSIVSSVSKDKETTESTILALFKEIDDLSNIIEIRSTAEMVQKVHVLRETLNKTVETVQFVQEREVYIGIPRTPFSNIPDLIKAFESYERLWELVHDATENLTRWIEEYFVDLDADTMISKVVSWNTGIKEMLQTFSQVPNPYNIIHKLKVNVDDFYQNTRVITALRNDSLRERHWVKIAGIIGISFNDFAVLRLRQVLELDLELVGDVIADISRSATIEYRLEASLEQMRLELSSKDFVMTIFRASEYVLIQNGYEALALLEDQLLKSEIFLKESVGSVMFVKFEKWVKNLFKAQELMKLWVSVQEGFERLYPIFSNSANANLLTQSTIDVFNGICKTISIILDVIAKGRKFITLVHRADLAGLVSSCDSRINLLFGSIDSLIDAKRASCARLYFVSNDDVIDMLGCLNVEKLGAHIWKYFGGAKGIIDGSRTSVGPDWPDAVLSLRIFDIAQVHAAVDKRQSKLLAVPAQNRSSSQNRRTSQKKRSSAGVSVLPSPTNSRKSFFALKNLAYNENHHKSISMRTSDAMLSILNNGKSDPEQRKSLIFGLISPEGEAFKFQQTVMFSSDVENVLTQIENEMKASLKQSIFYSVMDVKMTGMLPKVTQYPFQAVLLAFNNYLWNEIGQILQSSDEFKIKEFRTNARRIIDTLVASLNTHSSAYVHIAIENLINTIMSATDLLSPTLSTSYKPIRFRYVVSDENVQFTTESFECRKFNYGFEYQGIEQRLVITPVLHRIIGKILSVTTKFGLPVIVGSDCSGKESAIFELASYAGQKLFVMTLAEDCHFTLLRRTLHGALSTSAWVVFLNIQNCNSKFIQEFSSGLSLVKHELMLSAKARTRTVQLFGNDLEIKSDAVNIFATVPSMKVLLEIPVSLRSVFRPVGLSLPDKELVLEMMLFLVLSL